MYIMIQHPRGIFHKNNRIAIKIFIFPLIFLLLLITAQSLSAGEFDTTGEADFVPDGDTIILKDGRHVRYIGMNSPEITTRKKKGEPYGQEARKFNLKLVGGKKVRFEFDKERNDQYKRLLAYVFLEDGTFVNARMIQEGYAHCLYDRDNNKYAEKFLTLQREAMNAGRGMWRDMDKKPEKLVGNRNSRRFHKPHCQFGKKISKRNREWFENRWEAFWAGYAPCKTCYGSK